MAGSNSFVQLPADGTGKKVGTWDPGDGTGHLQKLWPISPQKISWAGYIASFRTPGRGATTQNLLAVHNATGSAVLADVSELIVEAERETAFTTTPPLIKISRFTVLPTGGIVLSKVPQDTNGSPSGSLVVTGDASADGTSSGSALTVTLGNQFGASFSPRAYTLAGMIDRYRREFIKPDFPMTLRPLEGICAHVIAASGADNPTTNSYIVTVAVQEYTL
jgi:hypothetical protein